MKKVIFKTVYEADTKFDGNDFGQMLNSDYVTQVDKIQVDNMHTSGGGRTLVDIFDEDKYELRYLGNNLGSHIFQVSNGVYTVDLQMANELFVTYFIVE